jgi:hypothetical protein
MEICSVGGELFHADGKTDMTKRTVDFRNFEKAPRNVRKITHCRQNAEVVNAKDADTYSTFCTVNFNIAGFLLTLLSFFVSTVQ